MRTSAKNDMSYQALNLANQIPLVRGLPLIPRENRKEFENEWIYIFYHWHNARRADGRCDYVLLADKPSVRERGSEKCENEMCRYFSV